MDKNETNKKLQPRPPIVVVLGHVDHGKTTLLDTIRKTNVVAKESGGITQHIGAYQVEHNGKFITFIDTPGHEAFCQMRSRGAKAADIAILVVAGEEGVRPQTKEVIDCIKREEIPVIVAVNKMDKPQVNYEKTVGELEKEGLVVESRGGKIPAVKISAINGEGIKDLLEMVALVAEMEELKADIEKPAEGVVVESYMDSQRGVTATFLVLEGILKVGQWIICGHTYGKIKSLENFKEEKIEEAGPSTPTIVLGLNQVPIVGERFEVVESEEAAKSKIVEKLVESPKNIQAGPSASQRGELQSEGLGEEAKIFDIILKADVQGSLEAVKDSLMKLDLENICLNILKSDVGDISETDVKLAYPANATIIGFRVKASAAVLNLAKRTGAKIRNYEIIYELFEGVRKDASKLLKPETEREELGKLKIIAIFRKEKSRMIVGGKVLEGKIVNKTNLDVIRNGEKITSGKIIQLQHNKKDMAEVEKGREAGILFGGEPIIEEGDILENYRVEKKKREL
ncbi:MAG: translation initiation factor IF-2 [Candidatus Portnoybacteria bacterium RIFCSPHIGHO2_01_FULL_39_19]|nr:MAG: translation initiation factor IF-2 [Candidatus Portnoybacteria bacterium RIFCSPHIGHO2_01_FULL_39_19]